ncbi:hypothetical protein CMV30_01550 [Nibricoccus aquaticus]|uniref:GYF domain-containing protein n=1 Tax=Nibricoccus aquaticus TaxID=2576891 RepID=A0A290Q935_9BACT|nr:DUF4339 domain-containing protein [Nibricoccus aquaticus]ATC62756.1 hypothetical protein CMV30_01550 [Nibricoccus aquaticus]
MSLEPPSPTTAALRYYLALDGQVSGPHGLDALRDMASVHAFTRDTPATLEGTENWQPIHAHAELAAVLFPAAAKFQLKAKAITLTTDSVTPVSVEEILRTNLSAEALTTPPPDYIAQPTRPPGRARNRDYALSALLANALGAAAWFIFPHNPVILVFLLSYLTIANLGLYWVMFHVMDRY